VLLYLSDALFHVVRKRALSEPQRIALQSYLSAVPLKA
jgi:hypothetical protein